MSKQSTGEMESVSSNRDEAGDRQTPGFSRLIREPLLHFLVLGGILFAVYGYWNQGNSEDYESSPIVVSGGKIEHLAALFSRTWQRPPTRQELQGLIDDYIREEAAYREGTAIGLDSNDTIIRRRIRQKLEFVADDLVNEIQPSEEELANYLRDHVDDFRVDPRYTFRQVFFDRQQHGDDLEDIIGDLVARLREDTEVDARELGDRILLEFRYSDVSNREIANLFGDAFAAALDECDLGMWTGPVESSYGLHVVFVEDKQLGSVPELSDVRSGVNREWSHARRQELTEQYYRSLIDKYEVIVQWPEEETK